MKINILYFPENYTKQNKDHAIKNPQFIFRKTNQFKEKSETKYVFLIMKETCCKILKAGTAMFW